MLITACCGSPKRHPPHIAWLHAGEGASTRMWGLGRLAGPAATGWPAGPAACAAPSAAAIAAAALPSGPWCATNTVRKEAGTPPLPACPDNTQVLHGLKHACPWRRSSDCRGGRRSLSREHFTGHSRRSSGCSSPHCSGTCCRSQCSGPRRGSGCCQHSSRRSGRRSSARRGGLAGGAGRGLAGGWRSCLAVGAGSLRGALLCGAGRAGRRARGGEWGAADAWLGGHCLRVAPLWLVAAFGPPAGAAEGMVEEGQVTVQALALAKHAMIGGEQGRVEGSGLRVQAAAAGAAARRTCPPAPPAGH